MNLAGFPLSNMVLVSCMGASCNMSARVQASSGALSYEGLVF